MGLLKKNESNQIENRWVEKQVSIIKLKKIESNQTENRWVESIRKRLPAQNFQRQWTR